MPQVISNLSTTWNAAGTTFTALKFNVTDTASASGSLLMDLQVGGASRFSVRKDGSLNIAAGKGLSDGAYYTVGTSTAVVLHTGKGSSIRWSDSIGNNANATNITGGASGNNLEIRSGTSAQKLSVYNTYTDESNYERGKMEWASNVLRIGTEKAGTGTARALEFQTDGTTRATLDTSGNLGIGTSSPVSPVTVHNATSNTTAVEIRGGGGSLQSILAFTYGNAASATATNGRIFTSTSEFSLRAEASQPITFAAGGSERMRLDTSGNLGLGVTPSAWESSCRMMQLGAIGTVGRGNSGQTQLGFNYFINSSNQYVYIQTLTALRYEQTGGEHRWFTAPSGTAGTAISFTQAMTLDASGNLGVGTTSPDGRFHVVKSTSGTVTANVNGNLGTFEDGSSNGISILVPDVSTSLIMFGSPSSNRGAELQWTYSSNVFQIGTRNAGGVLELRSGNFALGATLDASGNLGLGTATFGTSAAKVLAIFNGTEPSTGPADTVQFFSVDRSAGNTIPGIRCEGTGVTDAAITNVTVTNKIAIKVNGTIYYLLATTSAA